MRPTHTMLIGTWRHAHEEDAEGVAVYRQAAFNFAPSRGRRGFELRVNGSFRALAPGPTDREVESGSGRWSQADSELKLEFSDGRTERHRIVQSERDRIALAPLIQN